MGRTKNSKNGVRTPPLPRQSLRQATIDKARLMKVRGRTLVDIFDYMADFAYNNIEAFAEFIKKKEFNNLNNKKHGTKKSSKEKS